MFSRVFRRNTVIAVQNYQVNIKYPCRIIATGNTKAPTKIQPNGSKRREIVPRKIL